MTLTEYLQTAVTELRECRCRESCFHRITNSDCAYHGQLGPRATALADHVEAMLTEHYAKTQMAWGGTETYCHACWDDVPCPSLRSVAHLVSVVSGTPIPEGAQ